MWAARAQVKGLLIQAEGERYNYSFFFLDLAPKFQKNLQEVLQSIQIDQSCNFNINFLIYFL